MRQRTEQANRQQGVQGEQDAPERGNRDVIQQEIHQTSLRGNGGTIT
jgi:hypothetical protein